MNDCIFCRIVRGEIPSKKVYEDETLLAFNDVRPKAPTHILIIPKRHIETLTDCTNDDAPLLGKMLALAPVIAKEQGCREGFRTIINTGRVGGQEVYHLHIHILGGPQVLPPMIQH
ncbi:MAG TPA: histidine triad nucleotide-binding protein [Rhodocyclaceae bacterium]|nr:histidine triad nucleotide-binding protein [Rhodocyclaceae bacterium]